MKNFLKFAISIIVLIILLPACEKKEPVLVPPPNYSPGDPNDPTNLIYNGGFEGFSDGPIEGRLTFWEGKYTNVNTALKRSGNAAVWTFNNSDGSYPGTGGPIPVPTPTNYNLVAQWIKVEKNTNYVVKAWVWIDLINNGQADSRPKGCIGVLKNQVPDSTQIVFQQQITFLEKTHEFNSGDNLYVKFYVKTYAGSQVWHIDDVSIRKK